MKKDNIDQFRDSLDSLQENADQLKVMIPKVHLVTHTGAEVLGNIVGIMRAHIADMNRTLERIEAMRENHE